MWSRNRAACQAEMQLLYHCNIGPPFLEAGSRVLAPIREMAPLTARAAEAIDTYDTYPGPAAGFAEQVYCYDLLADGAGKTAAMLYNAAGDRGIALRCTARNCLSHRLAQHRGAGGRLRHRPGACHQLPEPEERSSASKAACASCRPGTLRVHLEH